jgi:ABC-type transport system involved in multi-copper enzyme maturation permease subunit
MKAIVRKEFRQGRAVLIFAIVMAGAMLGARLLLIRFGGGMDFAGAPDANWRTAHTQHDGQLMVVMLALPALLALFAGVGLFASEAEHGVLPVLFMLPFSRRRIWAAKLLAGVLLTALSSATVLLAGKYLMPPLFPFRGIIPWLDMALVALFVLSVGLFVTVLTPHVIGAAMAAGALAVGLTIAALLVAGLAGAPVLGYDALFDMELWLALTTPALLFASLRALVKGELLEWRHTALSHLPVLAAGLAVTAGVVGLAGHALTRYDRGSVGEILSPPVALGARALPLVVASHPVGYLRTHILRGSDPEEADLGIGWVPRVPPEGSRLHYAGSRYYAYRNRSAVVLDLKTGRELAVWRDSLLNREPAGAVSLDGRYGAVAVAPTGLTWGGLPYRRAARRLEVADLQSGRNLYSGTPESLLEKSHEDDAVTALAWSPSGEYLAFTTSSGGGTGPLQVMRRDGSGLRPIQLNGAEGAWTWGPPDDGLYVANSGALTRVSPDGSFRRVWPDKGDDGSRVRWLDVSGFSPDGNWFVFTANPAPGGPSARGGRQPGRGLSPGQGPMSGGAPGPSGRGRRGDGEGPGPGGGMRSPSAVGEAKTMLVAVTPDGEQSQLIWLADGTWSASLAWQSGVLHALLTAAQRSPKYPVTTARLLRWRPGEERATELAAALPYPDCLLVATGTGEVLLWPLPRYMQNESGQDVLVPPTVGAMLVASSGALRPFPDAARSLAFARDNTFITIGNEGRLITLGTYRGRRAVMATDFRTGAQTKVYP